MRYLVDAYRVATIINIRATAGGKPQTHFPFCITSLEIMIFVPNTSLHYGHSLFSGFYHAYPLIVSSNVPDSGKQGKRWLACTEMSTSRIQGRLHDSIQCIHALQTRMQSYQREALQSGLKSPTWSLPRNLGVFIASKRSQAFAGTATCKQVSTECPFPGGQTTHNAQALCEYSRYFDKVFCHMHNYAYCSVLS